MLGQRPERAALCRVGVLTRRPRGLGRATHRPALSSQPSIHFKPHSRPELERGRAPWQVYVAEYCKVLRQPSVRRLTLPAVKSMIASRQPASPREHTGPRLDACSLHDSGSWRDSVSRLDSGARRADDGVFLQQFFYKERDAHAVYAHKLTAPV